MKSIKVNLEDMPDLQHVLLRGYSTYEDFISSLVTSGLPKDKESFITRIPDAYVLDDWIALFAIADRYTSMYSCTGSEIMAGVLDVVHTDYLLHYN